mgnify:FL=1
MIARSDWPTEAEVATWLDKARAMRVGVIGERIIDEYIWVQPEGRSAKESYVTWRRDGLDRFPGGSTAVYFHIREYVDNLTFISDQCPVLVKTRYVERAFVHKVFSLVSETSVPPMQERKLVPGDLLVVADYGHGYITKWAATWLQSIGRRIALTVQANSLNWGLNTLRKWASCFYFVVDRQELALARRDQVHLADEAALADEMARMGASYSALTLGHEGVLLMDASGASVRFPALSQTVVDRVGAGDAFLAWSAPLLNAGAPLAVAGFVGSLAAGIQVGIIANSRPVTLDEVKRRLREVLTSTS